MSKKIIAVAAAAALALTGLVGVAPASAAMVTSGSTLQAGANSLLITSTVTRNGSGTLADPYTVAVPSSGLATSGTTLRFEISTTAARAMTVSATSGIRLVATVTDTTAVVLTGADSLTVTANASGSAEFRVYPTSTSRGVVTITNDGDITQIYVTGTVGEAYDIVSVTLPSFEPSKAGVVVVALADAFGNAVTVSGSTVTASLTGTGSPAGTIAYSSTTKRYEGEITPGSVAGQLAIGMTLTVATTTAKTAAFGAPNSTNFSLVSTAAAKTVAELNTQIATLNATITNLIVDYNKLAKRANKVLKKKVALK